MWHLGATPKFKQLTKKKSKKQNTHTHTKHLSEHFSSKVVSYIETLCPSRDIAHFSTVKAKDKGRVCLYRSIHLNWVSEFQLLCLVINNSGSVVQNLREHGPKEKPVFIYIACAGSGFHNLPMRRNLQSESAEFVGRERKIRVISGKFWLGQPVFYFYLVMNHPLVSTEVDTFKESL